MIILTRNEDALIDSMRSQTDNSSPLVTQGDTPGRDLMRVGGVSLPELPNPAVGGENGSKLLNGFSNGFQSYRQRISPFLGAMAKPPAIINPVQGDVGVSGRADRLHAGVMNQLVQYTPSQQEYVASYVGSVTPRAVVTAGR